VARVLPQVRAEFRPMFELAWPLVLAELAWIGMDLVDTVMVGDLGAAALGAVGLGGILFFVACIFAFGLLLGLDTLVSQAFGAGDLPECHRWLVQGLWLCVFLSPVSMAVSWGMIPLLGRMGVHPEISALAGPFLAVETWSLFPLLVYCALRRYLQAMNVVRPVLGAMLTANILNWAGNWLLISGHLGFPALGVRGSAIATLVARIYMALYLVAVLFRHDRRERTGLRQTPLAPDWGRLRKLLALGWPVAVQITLEVGVFTIAAVLAGSIGPAALAAHQVALKMCSVTFMVPWGVSSASAVRVGQAIGRGDPEGASVSGWTGLAIGGGFMALAAVAFLAAPRTILGWFTTDAGVIATGVGLLACAAAFQLCDGLQIVASGNLRGAGDTRTPMIGNTLSHWGIGLPLAYLLGIVLGRGVVGIWIGLTVGLIVAGFVLVTAWTMRARTILRQPPRPHRDRDDRPAELVTV
jgi:MATE family multidrug resistance protein